MNIENNKRKVNKKLVSALMAYNKLNNATLGQLCNRPVTEAAISLLICGKHHPLSVRLIEQVTTILTASSVLVNLSNDIQALAKTKIPDEILFPYEAIASKDASLFSRLIKKIPNTIKDRVFKITNKLLKWRVSWRLH